MVIDDLADFVGHTLPSVISLTTSMRICYGRPCPFLTTGRAITTAVA